MNNWIVDRKINQSDSKIEDTGLEFKKNLKASPLLIGESRISND